MSPTSMPMSVRTIRAPTYLSVTTKIANPPVIPIAVWGSRRAPTRSRPMAPPKRSKSICGAGSGVASATLPEYGDVILAEYTQPFNENDITYFVPLYLQTLAILNRFPTHITADAAFDAWYVYQTCVFRVGMAAIPLNQHGHPEHQRTATGIPLCPMGLPMHPTSQFEHTYGYRAQRFRCPLLFPSATGQTCE